MENDKLTEAEWASCLASILKSARKYVENHPARVVGSSGADTLLFNIDSYLKGYYEDHPTEGKPARMTPAAPTPTNPGGHDSDCAWNRRYSRDNRDEPCRCGAMPSNPEKDAQP